MWLANRYNDGDLDKWVVTEITDSESRITQKTAMNDRNIVDGVNYIILLPFGNYIPKYKWNPNIDEGYSMDTNDVLFFENPGDVDANNIAEKSRKIPCCIVKNFFTVEKRFSTKYQIKVIG